jgi:hypothetical protein
MITARYRRDYPGEFVILRTTFRGGQKIQDREWIDNPITNQHVSGRAAVILSDADRSRFDYTRLEYHNGGLRGSLRLQTYGTGTVWQHLPLNFYVTTDPLVLAMIDHNNYGDNTVVYTDRKRVLEFPQKFFLIPYCPFVTEPALATYLAAFDGHREVFVLGHNVPDDFFPASWINDMLQVMRTYADTKFYFVANSPCGLPDAWRKLSNVSVLNHRKFVTTCDI